MRRIYRTDRSTDSTVETFFSIYAEFSCLADYNGVRRTFDVAGSARDTFLSVNLMCHIKSIPFRFCKGIF